jgi:hypothetical protein
MIKMHPHQQVFFNSLVGGESAEAMFERDYWGVSYRQGLEYLVRAQPEGEIRVWVENSPGIYNAAMLGADRERIRFVEEISKANYALTNYRLTRQDWREYEEVYVIRVGGRRIMGVYKVASGSAVAS